MSFYQQETFVLMTLDPVHIGTGSMRLGRVDNSIVREPGTRLPKIPGTSLSGAIRQYAAYRYESRRCAGAGQENKEKNQAGHCRDEKCPVCYTFGYLRGPEGGQSGTVSIGDARLLLFPVYSLAGPVWATCPGILRELGIAADDPGEQVRLPQALDKHDHLNLGWLMLEKADGTFAWPDAIPGVPAEISARAVLVADKLFSQVVNSNLEVRTSVSIDPNTGAASEGKLFTYEAIPRATLLWMEVVEDEFRRDPQNPGNSPWPVSQTRDGKLFPNGETWRSPLSVVQAGLGLAEHLGIGGMGTRGFGRVRLLRDKEASGEH
jgi:CRISPR-associated protein Cmr4